MSGQNNWKITGIEETGRANCRMKQFSDDYIKITIFNKSIFNTVANQNESKTKKAGRKTNLKETKKQSEKNIEKRERSDSIKRSKDKIFEICYANDFEYFVTLTIDEKKLSRTDKKQIIKAIKVVLSNLVQRKDLKYILIPEYHKKTEENGQHGIHFHGLISGTNLDMKDSGLLYQGSRSILNWVDWKYGYTTAIKLDGNKAVCQYILKYLTKDTERILGKRYLSGGNIKREVPTEYYCVQYDEVEAKEYSIESVPSIKVKYITFQLEEKR